MDPKAPPTRRRATVYLTVGVLAGLVAALLLVVDVWRAAAWGLGGLAGGALLVGAAQLGSARDRARS